MSANGSYEEVREALERWQREFLDPALKRSPERQAAFDTGSVPVKRLYTPLDLAGTD